MENSGNSPLPFGMDHLSLRLDKEVPYVCLHFIMVFVRDQERSLRFYLDQLGFRLIVDQTLAGHRWIEVAPPDGTANIALAQAPPDSVATLVGRDTGIYFVTEDIQPSTTTGAAAACVSRLRRKNRNGAESSRDSRTRTGTPSAWPASMS
jgi:catechol 2,3-dioxygenase-like lactoylglutathione lyase family enzyme